MQKRILMLSALATFIPHLAIADPAPYVGGSIGVTTNTSAYHNFRGMPFTFTGGYGGVFYDNFYLAGEVFVIPGTATFSDHGLKTSYGYGASILPGVLLSDHTIALLRLGVIRSHFTNEDTKTGGQVGLGMQTCLTQNIDIRGEYDFTAYGTFHKNGFSNQPRSDTFNLTILYKFD